MSTKYRSPRDVPAYVLADRLNELADVVSQKRDRIDAEFTMRIPAECDRDADLVLAEAARRVLEMPAESRGEDEFLHKPAEQQPIRNDKVRAEFEAWASTHFFLQEEDTIVDDSYEYISVDMQLAWEAWYASRAAPDVAQLVEALNLMVTTHDEGGWPTATITIARAALAANRREPSHDNQ